MLGIAASSHSNHVRFTRCKGHNRRSGQRCPWSSTFFLSVGSPVPYSEPSRESRTLPMRAQKQQWFSQLLRLPPPPLASLSFGCLAYVHDNGLPKDKFHSWGRNCVFLGYPYGKKGWKFFYLSTHDFLTSRDVELVEDKFPFLNITQNSSSDLAVLDSNFGEFVWSATGTNPSRSTSFSLVQPASSPSLGGPIADVGPPLAESSSIDSPAPSSASLAQWSGLGVDLIPSPVHTTQPLAPLPFANEQQLVLANSSSEKDGGAYTPQRRCREFNELIADCKWIDLALTSIFSDPVFVLLFRVTFQPKFSLGPSPGFYISLRARTKTKTQFRHIHGKLSQKYKACKQVGKQSLRNETLHYLCQLGSIDVLCEVELHETSLHLCLKSVHGDGRGASSTKGSYGPSSSDSSSLLSSLPCWEEDALMSVFVVFLIFQKSAMFCSLVRSSSVRQTIKTPSPPSSSPLYTVYSRTLPPTLFPVTLALFPLPSSPPLPLFPSSSSSSSHSHWAHLCPPILLLSVLPPLRLCFIPTLGERSNSLSYKLWTYTCGLKKVPGSVHLCPLVLEFTSILAQMLFGASFFSTNSTTRWKNKNEDDHVVNGSVISRKMCCLVFAALGSCRSIWEAYLWGKILLMTRGRRGKEKRKKKEEEEGERGGGTEVSREGMGGRMEVG
ncbi:hypothetical protein M9H77_14282 [Catharanthus roseus]|uniref:Uncharacterized protein n=1 Tax=Catharanthus roseus TaxID=4058 RepID=A0ACC0BMU4_CATRO|nr:hypothetical protein M9H77_14282 [Catharanthus roseus]